MITFWAKLEYKQENRKPQKIRIDVNRFSRQVKQVLTPRERIHKFTASLHGQWKMRSRT